MRYFNHKIHVAHTGWERWEFINSWRRLYGSDTRWTPPYYPALRRALNAETNSHLARMKHGLVYVDAIRRGQRRGLEQLADPPTPMALALEVSLAAAAVMIDPRRRDRSAYLALAHVVNDQETFGVFLDGVSDLMREYGCNRLLGFTGLSPHLGSGVLQDQWSQFPPLHTPYNPPYLPDLLANEMKTVETSRLYHLPVSQSTNKQITDIRHAPAQLTPLDPQRLAGDLLPLLAAACENRLGFAPPDAEEAAFLLRWARVGPLHGWLALVDGTPAGFVLLQADLAARLRRADGGRSVLRRFWWLVANRLPAANGRILFGGVLPAYRRRGIGRQLLQQALAGAQGWQTVTVGPLWEGATAVSLLSQFDAQPLQTYALYEYGF